MKIESNLHADDWKSGTEALALCMICGGEYPPTAKECTDCNVSLSVVRRCPNCHKIVSAQHTKCVYCRSSFTEELSKFRPAEDLPLLDDAGPSAGARRFRAVAVSIGTFLTVFLLGMVFLRQINRQVFPIHVIANAHAVRTTELRRAPSANSSNVGEIISGTAINLTGFQENDHGRWMSVDWNNTVAYLPVNDLSAPRAIDPENGSNALKFYLAGMEASESAGDAVNAVSDFAKAFPANIHIDELRWVLAERLRAMSTRGGAQGAELRRLASEQYDLLSASPGKFAGKARDAMERPAAPSGPATPRPARPTKQKPAGLEIIGGSGTQITTSSAAPHEAVVLNQVEVRVRPDKLSNLTAGAVLGGRTAVSVRANGNVVIPAGASCQLALVGAGSSLSIALTAIEIDHRSYAVRSRAVEVRSGETPDRLLNFRLDAPLIIEH